MENDFPERVVTLNLAYCVAVYMVMHYCTTETIKALLFDLWKLSLSLRNGHIYCDWRCVTSIAEQQIGAVFKPC